MTNLEWFASVVKFNVSGCSIIFILLQLMNLKKNLKELFAAFQQ